MQNVKRRKKYRIRPNSPIEFFIGSMMGLILGGIIALGMNEIHPLF